jgi:hypothetical protein
MMEQVPIVQYHGGWPECCIEPAGFLGGQWEYYLGAAKIIVAPFSLEFLMENDIICQDRLGTNARKAAQRMMMTTVFVALYFGTGVSPCYRGTRLYNEAEPASKALVQKYLLRIMFV